ncbi:hypothetical protein GA0115240_144816 [Streptomyces sp. DvalAA-14]|nr:hypothetical protein GA0115240_144816 [Streptomyces sp. DvalAA-14]
MRAQLADLRSGSRTNKEVGDFAEAVTAVLLGIVGHTVIDQHTGEKGDDNRGLDLETMDADGKLWTIEVKGTRRSKSAPLGGRYTLGADHDGAVPGAKYRQGGIHYTVDRSARAHAVAESMESVGPAADQMGSLLVRVNLHGPDGRGTISVWDVDADGNRAGPSARETYVLDDVVAAFDRETGSL